MKIKEITVSAVVPNAQYANIQPSITIEVDGDVEEAKKEVLKHIVSISQQFAESGKELQTNEVTTKKLKKLTPFIGDVDLFFDKEAHIYYDETGKVYDSASKIAEQYCYTFDASTIAPIYANKFGVSEDDVKKFWKAKADNSTTFGTALHQSLESYGKWLDFSQKLSTEKKPVEIGTHPTFLPIVKDFFRLHPEDAEYEPFVSSKELGLSGQIDRLVIVDRDKKIVDIDDYKTNADLEKPGKPKFLKAPFDKDGQALLNNPIGKYTIQLNVYRKIVESNGWKVRNMNLHHWNGEWTTIPLKRIEI